MKKITSALKIFFAYITLCGLVMFPCFIAEEAIQVAVWGTWPAQDAKDWQLVMQGCKIVDNINMTLKIINYSIGWIQPLAFFSYRAYANATDYYIESLRAKIFAHAPEVLDGHIVTITVSLKKARIMDTDTEKDPGILYQLSAHKALYLHLKEKPTSPILRVTSMVEVNDHGVFLHPSSIVPVRQ